MSSLKQAKLRKQKLNKKPKIKVVKYFQQNNLIYQKDESNFSQNNKTTYKIFKQNHQKFSFQTFNLCYFDKSFQRNHIKSKEYQTRYFSQAQLKNKILSKLLSEQPKTKTKQMRTLIKFKNIDEIKVSKINSKKQQEEIKDKQLNTPKSLNKNKKSFEDQRNNIFTRKKFFKSPKCIQLYQNLQDVRIRSSSLKIDFKPNFFYRNSIEGKTKMQKYKTQQNYEIKDKQNEIKGWEINKNEFDFIL